MSLIPPAEPVRSHVQDVADQVKRDALSFVKSCATLIEANLKACWNDPQHTPQDFLDQFGSSAVASMRMNGTLASLVISYEAATGISILDHSILSLVKPFTENEDGTVTVNA